MATWGNLPIELLGQVFQYVSRPDRLVCSEVCKNWHQAVNQTTLWRHLRIYLDIDLSDTKLFVITRKFQSLIKSLELGWSDPYKPSQYMQPKFNAVTRQASEYMLLLLKSDIQLKSIVLTDWYHTYRFKKMIYLLSLFLKSQTALTNISFLNTNLNRTETLKLLSACVGGSFHSIAYLDIRGSYHSYQKKFNIHQFAVILEQLENLMHLLLDYSAFSTETIDALVQANNKSLQTIRIDVHNGDRRTHFIFEDSWKKLCQKCPDCRVVLHIHNITHFEDIQYFLSTNMPLKSFTMIGGTSWDQGRSRYFRKTLKELINKYHAYLQYVNLRIKYNRENVDDLLVLMIKECKNLQKLEIDCVIRNLDLIKQLCDNQLKYCDFSNLCYLEISPKNLTAEQHIIVQELYQAYLPRMRENKIDYNINHYNHGKFDILVQTY